MEVNVSEKLNSKQTQSIWRIYLQMLFYAVDLPRKDMKNEVFRITARQTSKVDPYYQGNKQTYDGIVLWVNKNHKTVMVSYLEGYKDRSDPIPFEDMIAAYDENGEMMDFGGIRGNSVLLVAE